METSPTSVSGTLHAPVGKLGAKVNGATKEYTRMPAGERCVRACACVHMRACLHARSRVYVRVRRGLFVCYVGLCVEIVEAAECIMRKGHMTAKHAPKKTRNEVIQACRLMPASHCHSRISLATLL